MEFEALGVDVGRVVAGEDQETFRSLLMDDWMGTPLVDDAMSCLELLTRSARFADRVYLISKAGPKVQHRTRVWLASLTFYSTTGIGPDRLHFVRDRSEKGVVCKRLGVTHFVDDRISALAHLETVRYRYLFAPDGAKQVPPWAQSVASWQDLLGRLI